jgi:hypothetical protein
MFNDYPERTRYDKKARNYRYLYDFDFSKYHWNDLPLKERDYWRGLVQKDEKDKLEYESSRPQTKKTQRPTQSRINKAKK